MIWQVEPVESFREVRDFYWQLIDDMAAVNDRIGWKKGVYPSDNFLRESLEKGELYSLREEGHILGAVILNSASNEGYKGLPWSGKLDARDILVPPCTGGQPGNAEPGHRQAAHGPCDGGGKKKRKESYLFGYSGHKRPGGSPVSVRRLFLRSGPEDVLS
ncbi:MAG: hypothetical protein ACFWUL_08845 [Dialister sp.]|jgi:hypothetical protein